MKISSSSFAEVIEKEIRKHLKEASGPFSKQMAQAARSDAGLCSERPECHPYEVVGGGIIKKVIK